MPANHALRPGPDGASTANPAGCRSGAATCVGWPTRTTAAASSSSIADPTFDADDIFGPARRRVGEGLRPLQRRTAQDPVRLLRAGCVGLPTGDPGDPADRNETPPPAAVTVTAVAGATTSRTHADRPRGHPHHGACYDRLNAEYDLQAVHSAVHRSRGSAHRATPHCEAAAAIRRPSRNPVPPPAPPPVPSRLLQRLDVLTDLAHRCHGLLLARRPAHPHRRRRSRPRHRHRART